MGDEELDLTLLEPTVDEVAPEPDEDVLVATGPPPADDIEANGPDEAEDAVLDQGVSDDRGLVRVWFEQGSPVRARVSRMWAQRVTVAGLEDAFKEAFARAALVLPAAEEDLLPPEPELDLSDVPALTPARQRRFMELRQELQEVWDSLPEPPVVPDGQSVPVAYGRSEGVEVQADRQGRARSVRIHPHWAATSPPATIARHVVRAAERARGALAAEHEAERQRQALAQQFTMMRQVYEAMMRKAVQ